MPSNKPELSLSIQRRLSSFADTDSRPLVAVGEWRSDFPVELGHRQKRRDALRQDANAAIAREALLEAKGEEAKLSAEELAEMKVAAEDDTLEYLSIELLGRSGVIRPNEREQLKPALREARLSFEQLDPDQRKSYLKYLGGQAVVGIKEMREETDDFVGSIYNAQLEQMGPFVGYVISTTVFEQPDDLPGSS